MCSYDEIVAEAMDQLLGHDPWEGRRAEAAWRDREPLVRGLLANLADRECHFAARSLNGEAARIAEEIAPEFPWATDEPRPDLRPLWETHATDHRRGRPGWSTERRMYDAWMNRLPASARLSD